MQNIFKKVKAQTTVELAIFGSVILLLFSSALSYIQTINSRQKATMKAFRYALKKAYSDNAYVNYQVIEHKRNVTPDSNNLFGQRAVASGSASVFWAIGKAKNEMVLAINDKEKVISDDTRIENIDFTYDTVSNTSVSVAYAKEGIATRRRASLQDTVHTKIKYSGGGSQQFSQSLASDGKYHLGNYRAQKEIIWETKN